MRNKIFTLIIIILIGLLTSYRLFRSGYFSMQDDMHVFRLQQLDSCLKDGQIPCRYISLGGMGLGYPLFNFYSPLPYYLAESFHLSGLSYIDSIKLVFIVCAFLRPLGMFLFSSVLFGMNGGLVSTIIYSLAPYQALNSYVRGAVAENMALSIIPFLFYAVVTRKYRLLTLFTALLALTHNLSSLYLFPFIFFFCFLFYRKSFIFYIKSILLGLCLSAFFIIPAILEKKFTTVDTMTQGYFYFVNHFTTLKQLFIDRFWGYGASLWGPIDDMSFQVGYLQWLLPIIVLFIFRKVRLVWFFSISALFFLFLTHNKSTFLWTSFSFLPYYQFPWRFLGPAILSLSVLSGFLGLRFNRPIITILILLVSIGLNISFFKEDIWNSSLTDKDKLSKSEIIRQSGAGLKDYYPKFSQNFPVEFISDVNVLSGNVTDSIFSKNSNLALGTINVKSDSALIQLPIVYFPYFELKIDGNPSKYLIDQKYGQISLLLSHGFHQYTLNFTDTPIRFISNLISIVSLIIYLSLYYRRVPKI